VDPYRKSFSSLDDVWLSLAVLYIIGLPVIALLVIGLFIGSLL
jgi:hypothetical protein